MVLLSCLKLGLLQNCGVFPSIDYLYSYSLLLLVEKLLQISCNFVVLLHLNEVVFLRFLKNFMDVLDIRSQIDVATAVFNVRASFNLFEQCSQR